MQRRPALNRRHRCDTFLPGDFVVSSELNSSHSMCELVKITHDSNLNVKATSQKKLSHNLQCQEKSQPFEKIYSYIATIFSLSLSLSLSLILQTNIVKCLQLSLFAQL